MWAEVAQRSYEESELNWTYVSFMVLATLISGIAIVPQSGNPLRRGGFVGSVTALVVV